MGEYTSPEGIEPIGKNKELGKILVDIDRMAQSLAEPFQRPDLSNFTLMVSIVGVSNGGIVKKLYKNLGLKKLILEYFLLQLLKRLDDNC